MDQVQTTTPRTLKHYLSVGKSSATHSAKDTFAPTKRVTRSQTRTLESLKTTAPIKEAAQSPILAPLAEPEPSARQKRKRGNSGAEDLSAHTLAKYFKKSHVTSPPRRSARKPPVQKSKQPTTRKQVTVVTKTTPVVTDNRTPASVILRSITKELGCNNEGAEADKHRNHTAAKCTDRPKEEPLASSARDDGMTERKLRAEALLEKLRNRKVPASVQTPLMPPHIAAVAVVVEPKADGPADNVSPTASDKQAETRKIQEDMELLRLGIQPHHVMPVASITVPPADEKPEVFKSLTARESELTSDLVTKERVRRSQDTATTKFELVRRRAFDLPLPDRLTKLEAIFQAIEHTLMFTHSQGCAWIFHRHRKSVENSCGYTFTLRHLAQIVYIYPDSYELKPTRVAHQGSQVDSIEVSPKPGGAATDTDAESAKSLGGVDPTSAFATARFAVEQIERRRRTFREQLLDYVDTYHKMFATERNNIGSNAVTVPGWRQIKRWHEDFSLNGDVPDLPQAELPLRCTTNLARPDKERIRWLLGQAASPASKETASAAAEGDTGGTAKADPPAAVAEGPCVGELELLTAGATQQKETKDAPVSKVSALLERIRAKEQRRKQEAMLGVSPEKMTERAMLSRLPGIADSVSYIFYAQRKSVLPLSLVCERLSYSARMPLSKDECKEHITKLAGIVPDWCRIETVSQVPMVRIIRTKSVKLVKQDLEDKIRALAM